MILEIFLFTGIAIAYNYSITSCKWPNACEHDCIIYENY